MSVSPDPSRAARLARLLRAEAGQTATEYLGMLGVVVAIIVGVFAFAPQTSSVIVTDVKALICRVMGGHCPFAQTPAPSKGNQQPDNACVRGDNSQRLNASVTIFSVKGGGYVRIQKQTMSDGKVQVTVTGDGQLGGEGGAGGSFDFMKTVLGDKFKVGANGEGQLGGTWTFNNDKRASAFVDQLHSLGVDGAVNAVGGPIIGAIWDHFHGSDFNIPSPSSWFLMGGGGVSAQGDVGDLGAYGSLQGGVSGFLGAQFDNKTGNKTIFLRVQGNVVGGFGGLGLGPSFSVGQDGDLSDSRLQLAVTLDKNGNPVSVSIQGKVGYTGNLNLNGKLSPQSLFKSLKGSLAGGNGKRVEFSYDLPLQNNPAAQQALAQFLMNPTNPAAAGGLGTQFLTNGKLQVQTYNQSTNTYGGDISIADGIEFGLGGSYQTGNSKLTGAWYYTPQQGWQPWTNCTG